MTAAREISCDVAVLGYGPIGAVLACLLARQGLSVVIIEQTEGIYDKPRAITIDHEALHALQLCGLGERLGELIEPHPGTDYLGVDGKLIRTFYPLPPPYPFSWSPSVVFIQPELEALLRRTAQTLADITVRVPFQAVQIEQTPDETRITIKDPKSEVTETIRACFVVGCDGASSFVRATMGSVLEDLAFDEAWMVVDAWETGDAGLPARCVQYCWPERPATFIRGPRNLRRWEIKLLPGDDPATFGQPENVLRVLSRFVPNDTIEVWRSAVYRFHALVAADWRRGRLLIAGDAAHQTPPFMGQGLCAGLRDAANLAWKLHMVVRRGANAALLDSYGTERKPHFRTVVARTKEIGLIIGELDLDVARSRDQRLRAEMEQGKVVTRQGIIPPLLQGFLHDRSSGSAGMLFVQPRVWSGAETCRLDDIVGPRFLLVLRNEARRQWLDTELHALLERIGAATLVFRGADLSEPADFTEDGCLVRDWLEMHRCDAVLVRPDRYVFGTACNSADLGTLIRSATNRLFPAL